MGAPCTGYTSFLQPLCLHSHQAAHCPAQWTFMASAKPLGTTFRESSCPAPGGGGSPEYQRPLPGPCQVPPGPALSQVLEWALEELLSLSAKATPACSYPVPYGQWQGLRLAHLMPPPPA